MADQSPTFMTPNNNDSVSGASAPSDSKPGPKEVPNSTPKPNSTGPGSHPGASPNKPAPEFM